MSAIQQLTFLGKFDVGRTELTVPNWPAGRNMIHRVAFGPHADVTVEIFLRDDNGFVVRRVWSLQAGTAYEGDALIDVLPNQTPVFVIHARTASEIAVQLWVETEPKERLIEIAEDTLLLEASR